MNRATRVLVFSLALLLPSSAAFAESGTLFLAPVYGTPTLGQPFTVQVYINTNGAGISAAEARLSFDPTALSVDSLSTDGSVLGSWASPPSFSDATGTVTFTGWTKQYYAGPKGLLLSITFTPLHIGTTAIRFVSGTALDSGAANSNIITSMQAATITVKPQEVILAAPPTPPPPQQIVVSPPPPPPPTLIAPAASVRAGSNLIVKGTAAPNATVYVWQQEGNGPLASSTLATGPDGSFTYVSDAPVSAGVYTLWAQAEGSDGKKSNLSQVIAVTAAAEGLAASVALTADVANGLLPYIILLLLLALGAGYLYHRHELVRHTDR